MPSNCTARFWRVNFSIYRSVCLEFFGTVTSETILNPLNAKFIKWSNRLKQIVGKLPTICLSVFDHFLGLALKELSKKQRPVFVNMNLIFLLAAYSNWVANRTSVCHVYDH